MEKQPVLLIPGHRASSFQPGCRRPRSGHHDLAPSLLSLSLLVVLILFFSSWALFRMVFQIPRRFLRDQKVVLADNHVLSRKKDQRYHPAAKNNSDSKAANAPGCMHVVV